MPTSRSAIVRNGILENLKGRAFTRNLPRPSTGVTSLGRSVDQTCIVNDRWSGCDMLTNFNKFYSKFFRNIVAFCLQVLASFFWNMFAIPLQVYMWLTCNIFAKYSPLPVTAPEVAPEVSRLPSWTETFTYRLCYEEVVRYYDIIVILCFMILW